MRLAMLSDSYVSDSIQDTTSLSLPLSSAPLHFAALCRGLVVLVALTLPIGLTLAAGHSSQAAAPDRVPSLSVMPGVDKNL